MINTFERYIGKEIILTCLVTAFILLIIILSHRLGSYLDSAANGLLAQNFILLMLGLQAIRFLVILMPVALLISIMLTLGRFYQDNEMTALMACGLGPGMVYRGLAVVTLPLAIIIAILTLYVVPLCADLQLQLRFQAQKDAEISMFKGGTFREIRGGRYAIYVGSVEKGGKLGKIFVHSQHQEEIIITMAESGYYEIDPESGRRYIILVNGNRYQGSPGQGNYQIGSIQRLANKVADQQSEQLHRQREAIPTEKLLYSNNPWHWAELHRRINGPISIVLMTFWTPLLAKAPPKAARYGRLLAAMLIYTIYFNVLGVGEAWLAYGIAPPELGLWWIHGLVVLLTLGLWAHRYGIPMLKTSGSGTAAARVEP